MKSIHIIAETLPEAWEKAVLETWEKGDSFPTQYDKPEDPNSRDVTAMIHVTNPMAEPRIHRSFPAGLDDLEKYRSEVLYGVHDYWINPQEGKWEYTYSQRIFAYNVPCTCRGGVAACPKCLGKGEVVYDQVRGALDALRKCSFTRRSQAVMWQVWNDMNIGDPSCVQRLWWRIEEIRCSECNGSGIASPQDIAGYACNRCKGKGKIQKLNQNLHIRSNDAYKAAFMNMYAFTELQAWMAQELGVEVGSYIHIADSFHIYGSYFDQFQGFVNIANQRKFEDRVWNTDFAIPMFVEGCEQLLKEEAMPEDKKQLVRERLTYLNSK